MHLKATRERRALFESLSPCNENPIICQKILGKKPPCLSTGALATPNSRFSQVHATERAEGRGVIWGYFHIFTIFRPDLLRHLEHRTEAEYPMGGSGHLIGLEALELASSSLATAPRHNFDGVL